MLTKQQLEEIAERAGKATEGKWAIALDNVYFRDYVLGAFNRGVTFIADIRGDENATFIANARRDIPDLLDHIAEQDAEIEWLQKQRDELYSITLWTTRRLPQSYKPMVYDWIDEATGKESERV